MTFFPGGRLQPASGNDPIDDGPQDAPWNTPSATLADSAVAASTPADPLKQAAADPTTPGEAGGPGSPHGSSGSVTLLSVVSSDPPRWRLVFLIGGDWGVWIRIMTALTVLTVLVALVLGITAAALAYILVQLPGVIAVLPPTASATIIGTGVTLLSGAALERRLRAWRSQHLKPPKMRRRGAPDGTDPAPTNK